MPLHEHENCYQNPTYSGEQHSPVNIHDALTSSLERSQTVSGIGFPSPSYLHSFKNIISTMPSFSPAGFRQTSKYPLPPVQLAPHRILSGRNVFHCTPVTRLFRKVHKPIAAISACMYFLHSFSFQRTVISLRDSVQALKTRVFPDIFRR